MCCFNSEHAGVYSHQAIAFSAFQPSTEYISRVKPLTMRLMPSNVPMAHDELDGQGRQTRYARTRVMRPSKRIHPEPDKGRNWKNRTIPVTPSMKKIAATTRCERLQCDSRVECKVTAATDVDDPNKHSP